MKRSFSKRITALLLTAAMSLCCFITSVSASEVALPSEAKLSVGTDKSVYSEGSTVNVTVSLSGSKFVDAIGLEFKFDDDKLEIIGGEWSTDLGDVAIATDNFDDEKATYHHAGLAASSGTISPNGDVFKLALKVKNGADKIDAEDLTVEVIPTLKISDTKLDCASASAAFAVHSFGAWITDSNGMHRTCSVCGKNENPTIDTALKPSSWSLTLESSIVMNICVPASCLSEYSNAYVLFGFNGKEIKASRAYTDNDNNSWFILKGIMPHMMADEIDVKVCAEKADGTVYCGDEYGVSVRSFAASYFSLYDTTDKMYIALVNMLNYGSKVQQYANYNTSDLADKNLTNSQKSLITSERSYKNVFKIDTMDTTSGAASVEWKGAALVLDDPVALRFQVKASGFDGLSLKATCNSGSWVLPLKVDGKTVVQNSDGTYYIYFDKLHAGLMSEEVEFTVINSKLEAVSDTLHYSIETYAAMAEENLSQDITLNAAMKAMIQYGDAVANYNKDGSWDEWKPVS